MKFPLAILAFATLASAVEIPTDMALVEGGRYLPLYGERERPVQVAPFLLDRDPVTNGDYLAFVRSHPEWRRSRVKPLFADDDYLAHWAGDLDPGELAPDDAPVVCVPWFAARAFLRAHGKRLPTEDEWEFAARADATRADATADHAFLARILAWYGQPTPARQAPVNTLEKDFRGIAGLHGGVWEWVADFNNRVVSPGSRDATTLDRELFCAGGAAGATDVADYAAFMRYALRSSLHGRSSIRSLGFRGARDLTHLNPSDAP